MACASIDSILYSRQTINIGFKFRGDYPTLEGLEQFTLEGGALGLVLGFFDRGTPASYRPEVPWKLGRASGAFPGTSTGSVAVTT